MNEQTKQSLTALRQVESIKWKAGSESAARSRGSIQTSQSRSRRPQSRKRFKDEQDEEELQPATDKVPTKHK